MQRERLDVALVNRGLVESRAQAQRLVMAGQVRVNGERMLKPSTLVAADDVVVVVQGPKFVSRGGEKLDAALQAFALPVAGRKCADVGASTGGFTDCLLQHGASKVYAIDVGYGALHWKLRSDPRIVNMERTNARFMAKLPEAVSLITVDVSFISLRQLLPVFCGWYGESGGDLIALVKPQFEAGREEASRGQGVIRNSAIHRRVLIEVLRSAEKTGYGARGLIASPLRGPKGNVEFLAWLSYPGQVEAGLDMLVEEAIRQAAGKPD
jgi:23S rRNA (cytidine1920-2'-O)/16S rRNA (cytidine1409-2'-O)-methyltransferase